jgi:2-polyprenyl-3-methyl-5-hydroxy-6-metoxy-1,4-benzoquinol methylase
MSSTSQNPQKNVFITGYNKASLDRYTFRTAETCCGYLIPQLEALHSDFTFLDIGCGPGSITTDLASRFPQAKFTGIDPGQLFIDNAVKLAQERGVAGNTSFTFGDLASLEQVLGDQVGSFDVVHCHQVLNHLPDPVGALKIMKSAAKSEGGIVAAREATARNGDIIYPLLPEIENWQKLQTAIIGTTAGPIPGFGPRLLESALHAGWARDKIKAGAGVWCYSEPAEKKMWAESVAGMLQNKNSEWYKTALENDATDKGLGKMAEAWREWEGKDESWCVFVSAEVICKN